MHWECVMRHVHGTRAQVTCPMTECRLQYMGYFRLFLGREGPSYIAMVFVNLFGVSILFLGLWSWEEEQEITTL